jgi:hypothetical protein
MRPFHDLLAGYRAQEDELRAAVQRVLESGRYLLGEELAAFERAFAAAVGVPHAVGLSSGTDALVLALRALDVGPEHEVVVPALTAAPTAMAVCAVGARLVLADVDDEVARWHLDLGHNSLLGLGDESCQVASAHVGQDGHSTLHVLSTDLGRPLLEMQLGQLSHRYGRAGRGSDGNGADGFDVAPRAGGETHL